MLRHFLLCLVYCLRILFYDIFFFNFKWAIFSSLFILSQFNNKFEIVILALLPTGPAFHSISSNLSTSIFWWCCSTRTELVQKWSLLIRIRTIVERISICFFEPGDLRFRPDSGQMEEDLDEVLLVKLKQDGLDQEELLQARGQSEEDLILLVIKRLVKWFLRLSRVNDLYLSFMHL